MYYIISCDTITYCIICTIFYDLYDKRLYYDTMRYYIMEYETFIIYHIYHNHTDQASYKGRTSFS